jgi:type IV pilus assembly protein PilW
MQILYGQDADNDGKTDSYVSANLVASWDKVASVRISLLLSTVEDNIASTNLKYSYEDIKDATAPDKRIRRVFTTTIAIRNRLQ